MSTLATSAVTLVDFAKRVDPETGGVTTKIAELLSESNEVLTDMLFLEGNLPTGHRLTMRTGMPASTWRKLNQGVASTKSTTAQVDESTGMLEQLGQIDKDLAQLSGSEQNFRLTENSAHMEAMSQDMAQTLFYGDHTANPERFLGLAPRYSSISGATNGQNILDAGGTGSDNTSVWLVCWGAKSVYGIFPKGSKAGLVHTPGSGSQGGYDWLFDSSQNRYLGYLDHYQWKSGLALADWRYVVRIANIDVSDLVANTSPADLTDYMSRSIDRIPTLKGCKPVFYVNRTVFSMLKIQALDKSNGALSIQDALQQFGSGTGKELNFLGIPVRLCDQLLSTEAQIT